ncbi:pgl [Plasmopara halstedii]|uniref:Pgl n=1 Tax=Plasmopara halstedii TaxID=4781 RepID=A0A0P1AVV6_PLAHL|nr:pgl [Plasmopara halstedii]CEG45628.1 pgl [Plasmopara halstedii]|eukprot:XP_024581997.1 pgl [Plasmopara halstedii]
MHLSSLFLSLATVAGGTSLGFSSPEEHNSQVILFAGSFTRDEGWVNGTGAGIYTYKFNTNDGSLEAWAATPFGDNPIYVVGSSKTFSNGQRVVYVVNSVHQDSILYPGTKTGYVSALTLNSDGTLTLLNSLESRGEDPTHISLSHYEDYVVVSNYRGSIAMFPLKDDGSLASNSFFNDYLEGSGVVPDRQDRGYIHSTTWLPYSDHVVAANLGSDELLQFELDKKNKSLTSFGAVRRPPGSGPRHMAIHPSGKFAYVVDELSNTVGVYTINLKTTLLESEACQTISIIPENYTNASTSADIHFSKDGNFLYTSNRGHDSIAMFKVDESSGTLTLLGFESTRGKTPRGFTVYGDWLIVANQNSNNMHVFKINCETGLLEYTGNSYEIGTAVCLYVSRYYI